MRLSMAGEWTEERRAVMRARIQEWKPWEQSTGAKTTQGKAKVSKNAYKGGGWAKAKFRKWVARNRRNPDKLPLDVLIAETLRRSKGLDIFNEDGTIKPD